MEQKEIKRLPDSFGIQFGPIRPNLYDQVRWQNLKSNKKKMSEFEKLRTAIHQLYFGGLITDSQVDKLFLKLYNKILRHVGKENGCDVKPIKIKK